MNKPTVELQLDCTPEEWAAQLQGLEKRLDFALEAEARRIEREQHTAPPTMTGAPRIIPPWWARMLGAQD